MSSNQGWFESDEDYQRRIADEANERIVAESTGSAPKQGWLESESEYRDRIAREANEYVIEDSTGDASKQGWFEDDKEYTNRLAREAHERIVEDSTGSAPKQGWLEDDNSYDTRLRREANERILEDRTGTSAKQGWFEGDHDYRSRISRQAREARVSAPRSTGGDSSRAESDFSSSGDYYSAGSPSPSQASSAGVGALLMLLIAAGGVAIGSMSLSRANTPRDSAIVGTPSAPVTQKSVLSSVSPSAAVVYYLNGSSVDPLVVFTNGQYLSPPIGEADKPEHATTEFIHDFYQPGTLLRLLLGGADAGTAKVLRRNAGICVDLSADVELGPYDSATEIRPRLAVTSNAPLAAVSARRPITGDQALQARFLLASMVGDTLVQPIKGITTDIVEVRPGDAAILLLEGNAAGDSSGIDISVIAIWEDSTWVPQFTRRQPYRFMDDGKDREPLSFLDVMDLDGDGTMEIVAAYGHHESIDFGVFQRHAAEWKIVYRGGGRGC